MCLFTLPNERFFSRSTIADSERGKKDVRDMQEKSANNDSSDQE